MTNPTPLSPAAQAVVTAIEKFDWESDHFTREDIWMLSREVTAAALRAAADQLVPVEAEIDPLKAWSIEDWNHMNATKYQREETRRQLLAIAAELEGAND